MTPSRSLFRLFLAASVAASAVQPASAADAGGLPYFRMRSGQDAAKAATDEGTLAVVAKPAGPTQPTPGSNVPGSGTGSGGTGTGDGGSSGGAGGTGTGDVADPSAGTMQDRVLRVGRATAFEPASAGGGETPYSWGLASGPLPPGLAVTSSGVVSGTPTLAGDWAGIRLSVSDKGGRTGSSAPFSLRVMGRPGLSYAASSFPRGQAIAIVPTLTEVIGPASYAIVEGAKPAWLSVDPTKGVLTGTPDAAGKWDGLVVSLVDKDGETASSAPFSIEVTSALARLDAPAASPARTGIEFALTFGRVGITDPVAYEIDPASGALPDGLTLDAAGNRLAGVPTVAGTFKDIVVKGTGANGVKGWTQPFSITVANAGVDNPGVLTATLNRAYAKGLVARSVEAGARWDLVGAALPDGLRLVPATGRIEGVPTRLGTYPGIEAVATDSGGAFSTQPFSMVVVADALQVSAARTYARLGAPVSMTPSASPATQGIAWTIKDAPAGVTVDPATGAVSGIPGTAGTFPGVSLTATAPSGLTGTGLFDLTVAGPLSASGDAYGAMVGVRSDIPLKATNLMAGGSWRLEPGSSAPMPPGLAIAGNGRIVGTPTATGTFPGIVARVTDYADNATALTPPFAITVAASDRMLVTGLSGVYGARVGKRLTLPKAKVDNAVGEVTFAIDGALPPGLTINSAGVIDGDVTAPGSGEPLKVVASDARPSTAASPAFAVRMTGPLSATGPAALSARVGGELRGTASATNVMGTADWELVPGPDGADLPYGTRFERQTGRIIGRPLVATTLRGLTLRVTDSVDLATASTAPFDLAVSPGLVVDGPYELSARVGQDFDSAASFRATNASGPVVWTVVGGPLPPGISMPDPKTGRLVGKPTQEGAVTGLRLRAEDAGGLYGESQAFTISVVGGMKVLVGADQRTRINAPFTVTPATTNQQGAVTWTLAQGGAPPGMSFDAATGRLYGTPKVAGSYGNIVFRARDALGQDAVSAPVTIQVGERLAITRPQWEVMPPGQREYRDVVPFNPFTVTGAIGSYTVAFTAGAPGMTLLPDGTFTGKWPGAGCCVFGGVRVTDSTGATADTDFLIRTSLAKPWLSGPDWPWSHARSSSAVGYVGQRFSYYDNGRRNVGIEGLIDGGRRHFEIVDPENYPSWLDRFSASEPDVLGTPTATGKWSFSVRMVDDFDGMSDVHTYNIEVKPFLPPSNSTAKHVTNRQGEGLPITDVAGYAAKGATFAAPSYQRAAGWCRHNVYDGNAAGSGLWVDDQCQLRSWPWDSNAIGLWKDLWLVVTDDGGTEYRADFDYQIAAQLTIRAVPGGRVCTRPNTDAISYTPEAGGVMGVPTYSITQYNSQTPNVPPAGMTFDRATGLLTGRPEYNTNNWMYGVTDSFDGRTVWTGPWFDIELRPKFDPTLGFPADPVHVPNGSFFTRNFAPAEHRWWGYSKWEILSDRSPPGVNQGGDQFSFWLNGYPTEPGTYPYRVRYTTDCPAGTTAESTLTVVVDPVMMVSAGPTLFMREGVYSVTTPAPKVRDSLPPMQNYYIPCCYNVPAGIEVDKGSGQIVGTPAAGTAGNYRFRVDVVDARSRAMSNEFDLVVLPGPGAAYPASVTARVGLGLNVPPTLSNVEGRTRFEFAEGAPAPALGVGLDSETGAITGTPTTVGRIEGVRVRVTDANGLKGLSNAFAIDVSTGPAVTIAAANDAKMGTAFSVAPTATGNVGATTWKLVAGTLPAGLRVDPATGEVKGTPAMKGSADGLRVMLTDSTGATATSNPFAVAVADGPLPANPTLALGCTDASVPQPPGMGMAAGGGGSGGGGGMNAGGSSSTTPSSGLPDCRVNIYASDYRGVYNNYAGQAWITDGAGGDAIDEASIVIVDRLTGASTPAYRYEGSQIVRDMAWIMSRYVTDAEWTYRTFYAVATVAATGETRTSAPFSMSGMWSGPQAAIAWQPPGVDRVATWKWDRQVCITTCNSYGACDARQVQNCSGNACPAPERSCYSVAAKGAATSNPIGSVADGCYAEFTAPNHVICW